MAADSALQQAIKREKEAIAWCDRLAKLCSQGDFKTGADKLGVDEGVNNANQILAEFEMWRKDK